MNQSKPSKQTAIWFVIGFLIVTFFQIRAHQPSCSTPKYYPDELEQSGQAVVYPNITRDASNTYAHIIEKKQEVTDWHSALYMYECRAALHCARLLGMSSNGVKIQIAAYYFHLGIFLTFLSILLYFAVSKCCHLFLLIVPLCLSFSFIFEWTGLGLDIFFFIHFTIMCCTLALIPFLKTKHMKILAWIIVAITLFHAVNFRKNAILLVPLIAYIFIYTKNKTKGKTSIRLIKYITLVVVASLISFKLVAWLLPVKPTHPISPMLSADLRIAAVLRGEQEEFRKEMRKRGIDEYLINHPYKDSLTPYWRGELGMDEDFSNGWETYISCLKKHTGSMFMSRFIQTVEFYCGGGFPMGKQIVEYIYPALKTNPQAWRPLMGVHRNIMYGRFMVLLSGIALVSYIVFRRLAHGRWEQTYDKPTVVSCVAALIYAGSFAVVPPTADLRYLAPSLFIIWNACWIWLAFTICGIERKKALENALCQYKGK